MGRKGARSLSSGGIHAFQLHTLEMYRKFIFSIAHGTPFFSSVQVQSHSKQRFLLIAGKGFPMFGLVERGTGGGGGLLALAGSFGADMSGSCL